jgi:DNA-binding response OmpR family regulator
VDDEDAEIAPRLRVLMVEDEWGVSRNFPKLAGAVGWDATIASSVRAARAVLVDRFDALVIDLGLPDGSGFDVIVRARELSPHVPALILTASFEAADINRAQAMRAEYLVKPEGMDLIQGFLVRCRDLDPTHLHDEVAAVARKLGLSVRLHAVLLAATLESTNREILAKRLEKSPATIKTQVLHILARTGASSFEEFVAAIRARARVRKAARGRDPRAV